MKKLALVSALALTISTISFGATIKSLDKADVTKAIQGKTITTIPLVTLDDKLTTNTFTGYFDANGQVKGQLANQPDNGPQTDTGKWAVKTDGTLCATWDHWNNNKAICVSIYKVSNGLLFINQQNHKLETLVLDDNIKTGNQIG